MGEFLTQKIAPEFADYGLQLSKLLIENISLPATVSEALDKRTSMGMIGNLDQYLQYQTGVAMETAAANPGGGSSEGIGMGVGLAMANRMSDSLSAPAAPAAPKPPPVPSATLYHVAEDTHAMGPFPMEEIRNRIRDGSFTGETLVWSSGMSAWTHGDRSTFDCQAPEIIGCK